MDRGTLQAGDEVSFLDEVGGGVVLHVIGPGRVMVRTDDGFEMEHAVKALPISGLHIFRPSLLTGPRSEKRLGERIGIVAMSMVAPLMVGPMRPYRPMPHDTLAKALLRTALKGSAGIHTHTYDGIRALADQNITDGSSR